MSGRLYGSLYGGFGLSGMSGMSGMSGCMDVCLDLSPVAGLEKGSRQRLDIHVGLPPLPAGDAASPNKYASPAAPPQSDRGATMPLGMIVPGPAGPYYAKSGALRSRRPTLPDGEARSV